MKITHYHAKYLAHEITKRRSSGSVDKLAAAVAGAQVDLNPHQVDAALFAFRSPLSKGAQLADEVGLRTFVLARMKNAKLGTAPFVRPASFSIEKHLKDSFGVFTAKGSHAVRLKFDAFAGQLVRERIWHPSQKIQELADGGVELTLQLSSLHEIEPWVLSWGEHVRILGPAELKKRVANRLRSALETSRP